jgi:hypothetical protein
MKTNCLSFKVSLSTANLVTFNGIYDGMCECCKSAKSIFSNNEYFDFKLYLKNLIIIQELIRSSENYEYYFNAMTLRILIKNFDSLQNALVVDGGRYHIEFSDLLSTYSKEVTKILDALIESN